MNADDLFSIGQVWDGGSTSQFFPGSVDDVRVYTRVLDRSEIQSPYNATK